MERPFADKRPFGPLFGSSKPQMQASDNFASRYEEAYDAIAEISANKATEELDAKAASEVEDYYDRVKDKMLNPLFSTDFCNRFMRDSGEMDLRYNMMLFEEYKRVAGLTEDSSDEQMMKAQNQAQQFSLDTYKRFEKAVVKAQGCYTETAVMLLDTRGYMAEDRRDSENLADKDVIFGENDMTPQDIEENLTDADTLQDIINEAEML